MAIQLRNVGTASATNGSAPTPGLPAGLAAGDVMVCVFFSKEVTDGTVSISAGWDQIINDRTSGGLLAAWRRAWQSGDAAPTFTLGGHATGNSGDSAIAQIAAFTGIDTTSIVDVVGTISTNASQANIGAISGISLGARDVVIVVGGKCDDWTSVATLSGDGLTWNELGEPDTTSGADAGLVWNYAIAGSSGVTVTSKTFTVTGGANNVGKGVMFSLNFDPGPTVSPSAIGGVGATIDPTVVLGSISIAPSAANAIAAVVDPTVVIATGPISPAALSAVAATIDPTVVLGSISIAPNAASSIAATIDPTVILGSIVISSAISNGVGSVVDPTVVFGALVIAPNVISSVGSVVDPDVVIGGTPAGLVVEPAPAISVGATIQKPVLIIDTPISPLPAEAFASTMIDGVIEEDVLIDRKTVGFVGFGF